MKNIVNTYVDRFQHEKKVRMRLACILIALAAVVTVIVFWQLHHTGIAMTNEVYCGMEEHQHDSSCYEEVLVCGLEESDDVYDEDGNLIEAGHVHTDDCYETQLTCGLEEHTHTIECMVDETADVETQADWEATLPDKLDGTVAENVIAVAQSQVGYTESEHNFELAEDGETRNGYTRYGAWYGNEYGEWNTMFAAFCLNYAGLTDDIYPENSGVASWIVSLKKNDMYAEADEYNPSVGDLIFLDTDADKKADVVDIIEDIETETDETIGEDVITKIYTVEGDFEDSVQELVYTLDTDSDNWAVAKAQVKGDSGKWENVSNDTLNVEKLHVVGYGVLPEEEENVVAVASVGNDSDEDALTNSSYEDGILSGDASFSYEDENMSLLVTVTGSVAIPDDVAIEEDDEIDAEAEDANAETENDAEASEIEDIADDAEAVDADGSDEADAEDASVEEISADDIDADVEEAENADAVEAVTDAAEISWDDITMDVTELAEDSDAYTLMQDYAEEENEDSLVDLFTVGLHFYYGDAELDMSDCEVAVEVTPTEAVVDSVLSAEDDSDEEDANSEPEAKLTMLEVADAEVNELDTVTVTYEDSKMPVMTASLSGDDEFGIMLISSTDPVFTVMYYATLPMVQIDKNSGSDANTAYLTILDTEKTHMYENDYNMFAYGTDAVSLPTNNGYYAVGTDSDEVRSHYSIEYLELQGNNTDGYKLKTSDVFTKIYSQDMDDLDGHPSLTEVDKLKDNEDYTLTDIYVWSGTGTPSAVTNKSDLTIASGWTDITYSSDNEYVFSTDHESGTTEQNAETGKTVEYINVGSSDNTVVLLAYEPGKGSTDITAQLFDYNITDGYLYSSNTDTSQTTQSDGDAITSDTKYVNTAGVGINSSSNYNNSSSNRNFSFGNDNTGTTLGSLTWSLNLSSNFASRLNNSTTSTTVTGGYGGAAFGLVTSGSLLNYANGLNYINNLFNTTSMTGKTYFGPATLTYSRTGDTYEISSISGTSTDNSVKSTDHSNAGQISETNLNVLQYTGLQYTSKKPLYSNEFWPLDNIRYTGMDPVFGSADDDTTSTANGGRLKYQVSNASDGGNFPVSDTRKDHNSFFGMTFSLNFTLTDDYCGPLEYYFFGDDDMWVYLSGPGISGEELVLDIGGVHSSIGEHVNLWNYIKNTSTDETGAATTALEDGTSQAGEYTLTCYYTERGDSGSTFYMWWSLPSVSDATVVDDYGNLRVEKLVEGEAASTNQEFTFTLNMTNENATLAETYTYNLHNADGSISKSGQTISSTNGTFTMKAGQYIIINNLPKDTKCEVTETAANGYSTTYTVTSGDENDDNNPTAVNGTNASGTVPDMSTVTITFTNTAEGELPMTGSIGTGSYTVGGMLLIFAAAATGLVYIRKRRKGGAIQLRLKAIERFYD